MGKTGIADPFVFAAILGSEEERKDLPSVPNMLNLRKGSNNTVNESFVYFVEKFLKYVVGVQSFNRGWKKNTKLSVLASPSDEALSLLLIENSEQRWLQEFDKISREEAVNENELQKAKYTSAGHNKSKKGITKKYGGWSNEGIERFNKLLEMVRTDREVNGAWFDQILQQRLKDSRVDNDKEEDGEKHQVIAIAGNDLGDLIAAKSAKQWRISSDGDCDLDFPVVVNTAVV